MNALDLLKSQHRIVERLFKMIEETIETDEKDMLADELADNLAAHATIEERLFYPAAFGENTQDMLREAVEEHLSVKRLLADLLATTAEDDSFDAKIKVLKEQIDHHVEEEEGELFKQVKHTLEKKTLEELGMQMEAMFEDEMAGEPAEKIADQLSEPAPLP
jgi:hypothetical protein